MAMNPWLATDLAQQRMRDLRAVAARSRRRTGRVAPAPSADTGRLGRPSLAHRAARALRGRRLRPA